MSVKLTEEQKVLKDQFQLYLKKSDALSKMYTEVKREEEKELFFTEAEIDPRFSAFYRQQKEIDNRAQLTYLERLLPSREMDYLDDEKYRQEFLDSFFRYCHTTDKSRFLHPLPEVMDRLIYSYLEVVSFLKETDRLNKYHPDKTKEVEELKDLVVLLRYAFFNRALVRGIDFTKASVFNEFTKRKIMAFFLGVAESVIPLGLNNTNHLSHIAYQWYTERTEDGLQTYLDKKDLSTLDLKEYLKL